MLRRVAIIMALQLTIGCNAALVRLEKRGLHHEVIDLAAERNRPPRRAGARALADALVAVGDVERARDVLLGDFRRGGQIASLVQLADLERNLGRDGLAAVHYARIVAIDRSVLRGRRDVCALLEARAQAWIGLGEGAAALDDLDATARLCGAADSRLRKRAEAELSADLKAQRQPPVCGPECDRTTAQALDLALDGARKDGPAAIRALAAREAIALSEDDIIALLLADLRGKAGARLLDDDELRAWIGDGAAAAFLPGLRQQPAPEGAYLRLRLERALGRSPDGGPTSASQRMIWLDRASVVEGAVRWRLLAYAGDLVAAEQDLVARWRPTAASDPQRTPRRDTDVVRPTERHWSLRVGVDDANYLELLMFARLRDAADDRDLALELRREVLRTAEQRRLVGAADALRDEVEHALGWGRPWLALALADVSESADIEPLRRAAATGVLVAETLCEGVCAEDRADVEAIGRTLGEPWIETQRASLRERALGRAQPRQRAGACPGLDEVLAPGAESPLAQALDRAREGNGVGVPRALVTAIESDPALACGARFAIPLLVDLDAAVTASRLSDALTHGTQLPVAETLTMHAALALLGNQDQRAEHLGIAAAAAGDPRETWRAIARIARRTGAREIERLALREVLLHAGRLEDDAIRRELVAHTLVDGARSWGVRDTPAGRESVTYIVEEHLARLPKARRWAEREAVFAAVARHGLDRALLEVVERTLLESDRLTELELDAPAKGAAADATLPFDGAAAWSPRRSAAAVAKRTLTDAPITAQVFADPVRAAPLRLALARHARDWGVRRRAAIGLAIFGAESDRAGAAVELLAMTSPKSRRALERLLLERPAAIDDASTTVVSTSIVPDDTVLLHVLFGLSPADALWLGRSPAEAR